jgi:hypothetical protein
MNVCEIDRNYLILTINKRTDPQHDLKNIFCLEHKYLHLLIYYFSGYFRRGVNFAFFSQTVWRQEYPQNCYI